jgi:hypothetical protein
MNSIDDLYDYIENPLQFQDMVLPYIPTDKLIDCIQTTGICQSREQCEHLAAIFLELRDKNNDSSPHIPIVNWGAVTVVYNDNIVVYKDENKDVMLFPGGAEPWDWTKDGTSHKGGVTMKAVQNLLNLGSFTDKCVIVLTRGIDGVLQVPDKLINTLEASGITVYVARTQEAVEIYNNLVNTGLDVFALIHSTC